MQSCGPTYVDTRPLLEKHSDCGEDDSSEHWLRFEERGCSNKLQLYDVPAATSGQQ
jgi:hypothetical protein